MDDLLDYGLLIIVFGKGVSICRKERCFSRLEAVLFWDLQVK